jgi:pimeloyl-ACP methyl ester carboxylesterase
MATPWPNTCPYLYQQQKLVGNSFRCFDTVNLRRQSSDLPTCPFSHMEKPMFRGPYNRVVLPEVGHFPYLERKKEFNSLVLD